MALATALALFVVGAAPAAAISVPTPPPVPVTGILPSPSPLPLPLPLPTPVPGAVGEPAPIVLPVLGGGAAAAAPTAAAVYQPSPDEQQALPDEPGRVAYEQQQLDVTNLNSEMQAVLGATAIEAGGGSGRFGWPVVLLKGQRVPLTQRFGCTDLGGEPYKAECPSKRWHTGIDLGLPMATPVFAADAGIARVVSGGGGYGNYVMVVHGNGWATLYGHLSAFAIKDGQVVARGEQVGFVGSSGFSTGPHLHFEIRYDRDYVDPCAELKC